MDLAPQTYPKTLRDVIAFRLREPRSDLRAARQARLSRVRSRRGELGRRAAETAFGCVCSMRGDAAIHRMAGRRCRHSQAVRLAPFIPSH